VAPDLEAISALSPGPFGGNMDVPDVKPGNTVYLPVWNEGALFYTGTPGTATLGRARENCAASR
jgi:amidase